MTDFPSRFDGLENLTAVKPDGERRLLKIESALIRQGRLYIKFAGVDSIESAEELRNSELCVPEAEAIRPGQDEFYDWQLIDCSVETTDGLVIGRVTDVMRTGAQEILVIAGGGREYLVPFVAAICINVDPGRRIIQIDPPEGLLEF